ncbi:MAG: tetratricopeptide repeat protein [Candidatus Zixiibacteriota bacterium]|nr:MAG: tetratricopeptide repeat protein [candidate division Zixibacteria bacterium]
MFTFLPKEPKLIVPVVIYYLMLLFFLAASYLPEQRFWGFGHWSYFSNYLRLALFGTGLLFPVVTLWRVARSNMSTQKYLAYRSSLANYWMVAIILTVALGTTFYLLRARTHFLGDGYTLIANLASEQPIIKLRNIGVMMTHMLLYKWLPGQGGEHALTVYRTVSIASGLGLCAIAFSSARILFEKASDRLLFALGLVGGGYSLQFFGYAEHYSMFVVSVALFTVVGVQAMTQKISRWWVIPALALSIFLHVFGVTLIPAAVFALLAHSGADWIGRKLRHRRKWFITGIAVIFVAVTFYYFHSTDLFIRFALMPIVENRFTVDHYTLLSGRHLLDLVNLVVILVPGLPILVAGFLCCRPKPGENRASVLFLIIVAVSTLGAAFIFDPKLGMPRDWDLLAFCGVPLAILAYYYVVEHGRRIPLYRAVAMLAIGLSFLSLFSRAYSQVDSEVSIKRLKSYVSLDPQRTRRALNILLDYYRSIGDITAWKNEVAEWDTTFPEWAINRRGKRLLESGDFHQALAHFRRAIELNPSFGAVYSNLGTTYLKLGQYDSARAYLKIANGMNPYSPAVLNNLGSACFYTGDYENSEKYLLEALSLDSTMLSSYLSLGMLYWTTRRVDECMACLIKASTFPDVPVSSLEDLAALYYRRGEYEKASETLRLAAEKGMDSSRIEMLKTKYPELQL